MQTDKPAFRWLRRAPLQTTVAIRVDLEGPPADSIPQAVHNLQALWQRMWHRDTPTWEDLVPHVMDHLGPAQPSQQWEALTGDDLRAAAAHSTGKAAGIDGWKSEEMFFPHACGTVWLNL